MRKLLVLALSCVLLVASLASCAAGLGDPDAINDYTPEVKTITTETGVFTFEEAEGDTAILVGYNGKLTKDDHVKIPETFNDRPVVGIGDKVFYNLAAVVAVDIPATVTSIGEFAFAGCTELESVSLPDGTLSIGLAAFNGCTKLKTVDFGDALLSIDKFAFRACPALESIDLPATLETIGEGAFYNSTSITEFAAPAALKEIGTLAFYNCTGLTSIKLSDTLEKIGDYAFTTESTTMKAIIDTTSYSEDSVAAKYVAAMADTVVEETNAPEETTAEA